MLVEVHVTVREGVLDPQGKAVQGGLHDLGYGEVQQVRVGRYFQLTLDPVWVASRPREAVLARVREMCSRLLANGVVEDFRVTLPGGA